MWKTNRLQSCCSGQCKLTRKNLNIKKMFKKYDVKLRQIKKNFVNIFNINIIIYFFVISAVEDC